MKIYESGHGSELTEYFFDDQPLEQILYDKCPDGPTVANLYLQVREFIARIENAYNDGHIQEAIAIAFELGRSGNPISLEMCSRLVDIMKNIVPDYPNPVMIFDLLPLKSLLEQIWIIALEREDMAFQHKLGSFLYRWYEHHGKYHDAIEVLTRLIEIYRQIGDQFSEAIFINNFAFEYMLEGRHQEAIPLFDKAACMFKQLNNTFQYANSRVNYWTCRAILNDIDNLEGLEAELKTLQPIFSQSGLWHERKPLILLAQIEEKRGNIEEAICLVIKAIESSRHSKTRYPEQDAIYLDRLQGKEADYPQG